MDFIKLKDYLDALSCGGIGKTGNRILSSATVELMGTNHLSENSLRIFII